MAHLKTIEDDFQGFLLAGNADIESHVVGTVRVPIATRLGIYGNAYRSRLIEALEANYPALHEFLGGPDFESLGSDYVHAHDSRFPSIRYYGDLLGAFLAAHRDYESVPFLAELARWEWAMSEVFDATDASAIDATALAAIAPEDWAELRLHFHPALRRLDLLWNVPPVWKALTDGGERPELAVLAAPAAWLIWRQELQIYFRSLSAMEARALDAMYAGHSFGELCEELCTYVSEEEAPARAAAFLRQWIESGIIGDRRSPEA